VGPPHGPIKALNCLLYEVLDSHRNCCPCMQRAGSMLPESQEALSRRQTLFVLTHQYVVSRYIV
jgi:hypothetical protein